MPRFPEQYVDSVVYLYPSKPAAERGQPEGACGFTVRIPLVKVDRYYAAEIYVVTNRHVIDNGYLWVRANTTNGRFDLVETKTEDWAFHPNGHDVAVAPIPLRREDWKLIAIPPDDFLTQQQATEWRIGVGDELFLVSRFMSDEGKAQNRPVLHAGTIARDFHADEGTCNPCTKLREPSYLVETHCRPGYSGSPVYGYIHPSQPALGVKRDLTPRTFLVGIAWGYLPAKERLRNEDGTDRSAFVTLSSGIAAVAPAWHIQDVLADKEKIVPKREKTKKLIEEQQSP